MRIHHSDSPKPLLNIWFHPRETIRWVDRQYPERYNLVLALALGLALAANNIVDRHGLGAVGLAQLLLLSLLGGLVIIYGGSILLYTASRFFRSNGEKENARTALAWSAIPAIFSAIPALLSAYIAGSAVLPTNNVVLSQGLTLPLSIAGASTIILTLLQVALIIWSLRLLVATLSTTLHYRTSRAIATILLAAGSIAAFFILGTIIAMN